jgi:hypothetical protein
MYFGVLPVRPLLVVAGASLALAACTSAQPVVYVPAPSGFSGGVIQPAPFVPASVPAAPPVYNPPPIPRAYAPRPMPPQSEPLPNYAGDCTGWWRICHFF